MAIFLSSKLSSFMNNNNKELICCWYSNCRYANRVAKNGVFTVGLKTYLILYVYFLTSGTLKLIGFNVFTNYQPAGKKQYDMTVIIPLFCINNKSFMFLYPCFHNGVAGREPES